MRDVYSPETDSFTWRAHARGIALHCIALHCIALHACGGAGRGRRAEGFSPANGAFSALARGSDRPSRAPAHTAAEGTAARSGRFRLCRRKQRAARRARGAAGPAGAVCRRRAARAAWGGAAWKPDLFPPPDRHARLLVPRPKAVHARRHGCAGGLSALACCTPEAATRRARSVRGGASHGADAGETQRRCGQVSVQMWWVLAQMWFMATAAQWNAEGRQRDRAGETRGGRDGVLVSTQAGVTVHGLRCRH